MRSIRQIFGLVSLTIILVNCNSNNGFIIKGHIEGIKDSSLITLYDLDQQVCLDSAFSKNGDFILKNKVEKPTGCWLRCGNEYANIQVENTEMSFNSPIKNMNLYCVINGGAEQELANDLQKKQFPYYKQTFSAYDSLMNVENINEKDQQRLIKILNESQTIAQGIYIDFGKKHPDSFLGLDILYRNRKSIPKDSLKLIYENLPKSLKENPTAKSLKVFLYEELAQKGSHFIDFNAKTLKGENFQLSSLKGNYIYLSFWSAGCGPCRMENKLLSHSFKNLPKNLSLVSFSIDKNMKSWNEASETDSILWNNVSDYEGGNGRVKTQYEVQGIPSSFLIDKNGIIIEKFEGYEKEMVEKIKTIIEKREIE